MKQPSREEYERAVALARAAIEAQKKTRDTIRNMVDRSPQAVLAKMQAKAERGEALGDADQGALMAALAELTTPKKRGRGRPKGTRKYRELGAFEAAAFAVQGCGLHLYENGTRKHRLTKCDAIAEAMKKEGFHHFSTYDAAVAEMKPLRRYMKAVPRFQLPISKLLEALRATRFQLPQAKFDFSGLNALVANSLQQSLESTDNLSKALQPMNREVHHVGRLAKALAQHIRAQTTLSPGTRRAIERRMKTKR